MEHFSAFHGRLLTTPEGLNLRVRDMLALVKFVPAGASLQWFYSHL